ncbi:4'-phosphopantetheinyl transferase family protein [Streptomyces daliensis]
MDDAPDGARQPELWLLRLPDEPPRTPLDVPPLDVAVLDETERARGAAFAAPRDARRYLAAHVLLRHLLAARLGVTPREVPLERAACPNCGRGHGRPRVPAAGAPHFSLSHSGGLVLVAVADKPVGADVQRAPASATADVCAGRLHPDERAELARTPHERRGEHFARIWARKEAYLKGLGTGLCRPPRLDYLGADTSRLPRGWAVRDVPLTPSAPLVSGYAAAVALGGTHVPLAPPHVRHVPYAALADPGRAQATLAAASHPVVPRPTTSHPPTPYTDRTPI